MELVYVADRVLATVEALVDELRPTTEGVVIPYPGCDMLARMAAGAAPTSCYPQYPVDGGTILKYVEACNSGRSAEFLDDFLRH